MMQEKQMVKDLSKLQNQLNKLLVKTNDSAKATPSLIKKVKRIYYKLFSYFSTGKVKKLALGSAAALLLQGNVYAQSFGNASSPDPYGLNTSKVGSYKQPIFVDLDDDGDDDILVIQGNSRDLKYIPNTTPASGSPISFGAAQSNPFSFSNTDLISSSIDLADLDNDGDFDLIFAIYGAAPSYINTFIYCENTGTATSPTFNTNTTNPFSLSLPAQGMLEQIDFVDFDGDGDFDIFAQGSINYAVTNFYFQNTGSNIAPSYAAPITNTPFGLPVNEHHQFIDIDNDGDLDMFSKSGTSLLFRPNTGTPTSPTFGLAQNSPFALSAANMEFFSFGDIDGDGDADFLRKTSSSIYVQLNLTPTSVGKVQNQNLDINIYPTPSHDLVNIKLGKQDDYTLEVFNLQGQQLKTENIQQATQHQLNLSELASGQYLLRISNAEAYTTKQLIKQ